MIRFGIALFCAAFGISGITWLAYQQLWIPRLPSFFYQTLIFLVFGTMMIFIYLYRNKKPSFFVQLYLLTMVVKMIAYGAYNFVMIQKDPSGAGANVVYFMALYGIFTGLEIIFLYRRISIARPS